MYNLGPYYRFVINDPFCIHPILILELECGIPMNPAYGDTVTENGLILGSDASLKCHNGYRLPDGESDTVTCSIHRGQKIPTWGSMQNCEGTLNCCFVVLFNIIYTDDFNGPTSSN